MKIVVLDGYACNPGDLSWEGLEALGDLRVYDRTSNNPADQDLIVMRAAGADAVFTNKTPLTASILAQLPNLKYIGVLATGYNIVDVKAATAQGITVTNVPDYSTAAVAQLTFALLLELCHHAGDHSLSVHRGDWTNNADFSYWLYTLRELAGKVMGIIGYGRIGRSVARIAKAMGMDVVVHSNHPAPANDGVRSVSLDELFDQADVVSLHCPLTDATRGLINKQSIEKMRDGVLILNTSRGPVVVEQDLRDALDSGKVAGAAMDVVSVEPIPGDNPLLGAPNCIITPHFGWAPFEARVRLMDIAANNLRQFLAGSPVHVVTA